MMLALHKNIYMPVGVLIVNWNDVERQIHNLMQTTTRLDKEVTNVVFTNLNNKDRMEVLKSTLPLLYEDSDRSLLETFINHTGICAQNRNLLAHIHFMALHGDEKMIGFKTRNKDKTSSMYQFSVEELQNAADSTMETAIFGRDLHRWLSAKKNDDGSRFMEIDRSNNALLKLIIPKPPRKFPVRRPLEPPQPTLLSPLPRIDQT